MIHDFTMSSGGAEIGLVCFAFVALLYMDMDGIANTKSFSLLLFLSMFSSLIPPGLSFGKSSLLAEFLLD